MCEVSAEIDRNLELRMNTNGCKESSIMHSNKIASQEPPVQQVPEDEEPGSSALPPYQPPEGTYPPPIAAQPTAFQSTSTTVVVTQPSTMVVQQQQPRPWSSGLCGCFEDCGICKDSYFVRIVYLWNDLPLSIRQTPSVKSRRKCYADFINNISGDQRKLFAATKKLLNSPAETPFPPHSEKVAADQIQSYLNERGLFPSTQSTNRQHHSTETVLLKVKNDNLMNMEDQRVTLLVLLDLSAAFDTVDHGILLDRLQFEFGISGSALNCNESYPSNRTQRISIDGILSNIFNLKSGIPQGFAGLFCEERLLCDISYRMGEGCCLPYLCKMDMVLAGLRIKLRTQENIQGSVLDDYLCSTCCTRIVLCQMARELRHIGK
ncbi:Cornifelin-like protein [Acropora cervicornis]|uniref:Cornifelin-like protein n=1 Tax=Acropora cervicornis TaxID=6130 RepID=A0AAD9Q9Q0_ACRCE|nr:Cornifelin-like protein [Acropora cervicornis]